MAKKNVFQYTMWYRDPKGDNTKDVNLTPGGPVTVEAANQEGAKAKAWRAVAEDYVEKIEDIEVVIRPF